MKDKFNDYKGITKDFITNVEQSTRIDLTDQYKRLCFELSIFTVPQDKESVYIDAGAGYGILCGLINYAYPMVTCYAIDDFDVENAVSSDLVKHFKSKGVKYIRSDTSLDTSTISEIAARENLSLVSSLHSIEHWHHSPAKFLYKSWESISDGGKLILALPNNSNIKKRMEALIGRTSWSNFNDWFDEDSFRGHVREPNIHDLHLIAKRLSCSKYKIYGQNHIALSHPNSFIRFLSSKLDIVLKLFPSICSDFYIVLEK